MAGVQRMHRLRSSAPCRRLVLLAGSIFLLQLGRALKAGSWMPTTFTPLSASAGLAGHAYGPAYGAGGFTGDLHAVGHVPAPQHPAARHGSGVQMNAAPEIVPTPQDFDAYKFVTDFLIALVPAILLELTLLPPGQWLSRKFGFSAKEKNRPYVDRDEKSILQQAPFGFSEWTKHRSNPDRYIKTTLSLLGSPKVLKRLQRPLFFLNVISTVVLFYDTYIVPQGYPSISLPALPFTISSSALGLLLVFRVTGSNNRYVLARGIWGDILNVSRDLNQQASLWAKNHDDFLDFTRWCPAFAASLMVHLRDPARHDLARELKRAGGPPAGAKGDGVGLSEEDIKDILNRPAGFSAPHYVLHRLRTKIGQLGVGQQERLLMEANITRLINDMGACENVLATPIPVGYTKHTTRFLFLWLALLPLALTGDLGVATVFGEQIIAFGLLGIEDVGIQLEEPFAVLPIERITTKTALESQVLRKQSRDGLRRRGPPQDTPLKLETASKDDLEQATASDILTSALNVF
mmetsp:Transcript_126658/g.319909  ORF Transcript_126658/g.319909 Transcript_126658/m.319909 type:complete len:519 (-) Transcript_126658:241-1797(-)